MEENRKISEEIDVGENKQASDFASVSENVTAKENIEARESIPDEDEVSLKRVKKKTSIGHTLGFTTAGLCAAVGAIFIASGDLVNFDYAAQFNEFYFDDYRLNYQVEANSYNDEDNSLVIEVYQDRKAVATYPLLDKYEKMQDNIYDVYLCVNHKNTYYDLNETPLTEIISYTNAIDYVGFTFIDENESLEANYKIYDKGVRAVITGYFILDFASVIEKAEQGEATRFDATLKGSCGLVERTFDNYAIKVSKLVSEFNGIEGKCYCEVDGTYHVKLDYQDQNGFFSFEEIYMKDLYGKESERISGLMSWHDDIKIPVLELAGGSAEIHLVYHDTVSSQKIELIFKDNEKDIIARYNDGEEQIFKSLDQVMDIKI